MWRWNLRFGYLLLFKVLCATCSRKSSLAFAIDNTYSMDEEIKQVIDAAGEIMDIVMTAKASEIEDVILVTFNDPDRAQLRNRTTSKYEFLAALHDIKVHGGNDCPEYSLTGIKLALEESRHGSYIFVFTDANAKDVDLLNEVKSLCENKESQVIIILTGQCLRSSRDSYTVYYEIAKASSGQVFRVNKDEVKDVVQNIKYTINDRKEVITTLVVPASREWTPVPFTVDDKIEYAIISTAGSHVELFVADASPIRIEQEVEKIMWTPSGKVVKFSAPRPGSYVVWVKGESEVSIVVYARTDFTFEHGFSEFVPKSLSDASKQPIANRKHHLSISVVDPEHTVKIESAEILNMNEQVIMTLPLKKANHVDFYITDTFVSPLSMFKIQVTGRVKETGQIIRRISKTAIEPQTPPRPVSKRPVTNIIEEFQGRVDVKYDGKITLTCKISGYPTPEVVWTTPANSILSRAVNEVKPPYEYISYLKLKNVKHPGTYYCRASNEEGVHSSTVYVQPRSPFKFDPSPTEIKVQYGQEKKLICAISSSYPFDIKWSTPLKPTEFTLSADKRVLTIKQVNIAAQGGYTCEATLNSDPKQKHSITTNVLISDLAPPSRPATSGNITILNGEKIHIWCRVAGGVPPPSIKWQFTMHDEHVYRDMHVTGEQMTINNSSLANAGLYRCIAKNDFGETEGNIKVVVQKAPVVTIQGGSKKSIAYGSSTSLTCNIVAFPLPTVGWRDSKGHKLNSKIIKSTSGITSKLNLQNVRGNDTYYCYATNILGNINSHIDISVTSPFVILSHPEEIKVQYGQEKKLICAISSSYPFDIKWSTPLKPTEFTLSADKRVLTIKQVNIAAQGGYTCEATLNSDPKQKHSITTNVLISDLAPPSRPATSGNITILNGEKIHIWCRVAGGVPPPSIKWQFTMHDEHVYRDMHVTGEQMTINNSSLANAGLYRCIAKNDFGETEENIKVVVHKAPVVTIQGGSKKSIAYGSSTSLTCNIVAFPLPTIGWRDSKGHKLNSKIIKSTSGITSKLNLQNVRGNDTYYCYATNILGNINSHIDISVTSPFVILSHPEGTTFSKYGAKTDITCSIKSSFPYRITWYKSVASKITEISSSGPYAISSSGTTLHIQPTDLNAIGKYTCEVTLADDVNAKLSFTTDVQISDLSPPIIRDTVRTKITVQNNDPVTIKCKIASGTPPPFVNWQVMRRGEKVFHTLPDSGQELIISSATLRHAGKYRCIATNMKGDANKTTELIVIKAPEVSINEAPTVTVPYGSTSELHCRAIAFPAVNIVWRDNEGNELASKITINNNEAISTLTVQHTKTSVTKYTCNAENALGKSVASVQVTVTSPIAIPTNLPETTVVKYGDPTTIICDIQSSFPIKIKWYYQKDEQSDKSEIHQSYKYMISPDERGLHISSVDLDLVGKYTCEASLVSNKDENKSFTTNVEISNLKAPEIIYANNTVTVMNGHELFLTCKSIGVPEPVVTWQVKAKNSDMFVYKEGSGQDFINSKISYEWAGLYKCTAANQVSTQSHNIEVIVHGKPKITNSEFVYFGVTGDKTLKIPCEVTGIPEPTISWKHGNKAVTSDTKITVSTNYIVIKNPTESDSSNFTCDAINDYGMAAANFEAIVSDFIMWDEGLNTNIFLKPGESKDIECLLPYSNPQSVRWYVNGENAHVVGHIYSIRDAKFENDGNYTCRSSTDQESESLNYVVDVGYKPSFKNMKLPSTFIWNGDMQEILDCDVDAKPRVKVEWVYNGKPLSFKGVGIPVSGWGTYSCNVSNYHGSVQHTYNVTSDGCIINRTAERIQNTPLIVSDEPSTWPQFIPEFEYLTVSRNQKVILDCSTQDQPQNTFKTHPTAKIINAECLNEDKFMVDKKAYKFEDLQCKDRVKSSSVVTEKTCMNNGKIIEIGFKLNGGFLGVYDVCYSDADHKTLFTKVVMSNVNIGNKVESSFMLNEGIKTGKINDIIKSCRYNQRWLVNPVDVAFGPAQTATLSKKYNSVPVYEPCDSSRMSWSDVEYLVQSSLLTMNTVTVWTGASNYNSEDVPLYLWKVVMYDDDTFDSIVYVNVANADIDFVCPPKSSNSLLEYSDHYIYSCTIDDFLKAFNIPKSDLA